MVCFGRLLHAGGEVSQKNRRSRRDRSALVGDPSAQRAGQYHILRGQNSTIRQRNHNTEHCQAVGHWMTWSKDRFSLHLVRNDNRPASRKASLGADGAPFAANANPIKLAGHLQLLPERVTFWKRRGETDWAGKWPASAADPESSMARGTLLWKRRGRKTKVDPQGL
jgi:hypothetical protein